MLRKIGQFIAVEGFEGTGKSTLIEKLKAHLEERGYEVEVVRQPGGTPFSEALRTVVKDKVWEEHHHEVIHPGTEYLLMSAARNQLVKNVIEPYLKAGKIVITDRHTLSSTAYQDMYMASVDKMVSIVPDVTIYLDAPFDVCMERMQSRGDDCRIEAKGVEYLKEVYKRYFQGYCSGFNCGHVVRVDTAEFESDDYNEGFHNAVETISAHFDIANTHEMVDVKTFEAQVLATEGIRVIVRADVTTKVPAYIYDAMPPNATLAHLETRLDALLKGNPYCIATAVRNPIKQELLEHIRFPQKEIA